MNEHQKHVLVVEDERPLSKALQTKLTEAGIEVTVVENGKDALALILQQTFDLILLDIVLPAMNGLELMEELVRQNIDVSIVVISNLSRDDEIVEAKRLGAVEYFIKSETSLKEIVDRVLAILNR